MYFVLAEVKTVLILSQGNMGSLIWLPGNPFYVISGAGGYERSTTVSMAVRAWEKLGTGLKKV